MRFVFGMPFNSCPPNPEFTSGPAIAELAGAAEAAGFAGVYFTEHPAPGESWRQSGGHDALDPFVGLSFVAAATERARLLTNLTVLPYRNPLLMAKTVATLDRLSGGRLTLGVGTGYLDSEYQALGVDFAERNQLFEESVEVMRLAFSGQPFSYRGLHFDAHEVTSQPTPVQLPHPPLWLGGNSKLTRRRVAEWGQGWMPMPNPRSLGGRRRSAHLETMKDLAGMLAYMREHAESVGRSDPIDIMYMTFEGGMAGLPGFDPRLHLESIQELASHGVTWLASHIAGDTLPELLDSIAAYGSDVIDEVG